LSSRWVWAWAWLDACGVLWGSTLMLGVESGDAPTVMLGRDGEELSVLM
jgi:hypothetical protein